MKTFVMLTKLESNKESHSMQPIPNFKEELVHKIIECCPKIHWINDYTILGLWHHIGIFSAPDMKTAMEVSTLVQNYWDAHVEIWPTIDFEAWHENIGKAA